MSGITPRGPAGRRPAGANASSATAALATAPLVVAVDKGDIGVRLDRVLQRHLAHVTGVTRNRLQNLITGGHVRVNGRAATRTAARLAPGDVIEVQLPARPRRPTAPARSHSPLAIVYEDAHLLIVDKPAGQVVHPTLAHGGGTLLDALEGHAAGGWTPGLVSRLDKGTSGLVLVAKDAVLHARLQRMSANRAIDKDYLAVVHGRPPRRGTIDLALDRDPWDRRKVTVRDRGGVPSVTLFERLASVEHEGDVYSLVRCRLVTGRTHQIRVHLAAKGWPIAGDPTYGRGRHATPVDRAIGRQALHAWRLAFPHPHDARPVTASAPLPDDFSAGGLLRFGEIGQHRPER